MSFPWNITNPGILIEGLPTAAESAFLTNLTGLAYEPGDLLYFDGTDLNRLESGLPGQLLSLDVYSMPQWITITSLSVSFESVAKNLDAADAEYNYTGDNLTSIVYSNGITKTFNYTGDNLTSIVLSGSTPGGISLTKTFTYSGEILTDITYS